MLHFSRVIVPLSLDPLLYLAPMSREEGEHKHLFELLSKDAVDDEVN